MNRKRQDLQRRRLGIIDRPSAALRVFALCGANSARYLTSSVRPQAKQPCNR
jgi:hypothetical protein